MEDKIRVGEKKEGDPVVVCKICGSSLEVMATTYSHHPVDKTGDINWDVDLTSNDPDETTYEVYCSSNADHKTGFEINNLGSLVLITEEDKEEEKHE